MVANAYSQSNTHPPGMARRLTAIQIDGANKLKRVGARFTMAGKEGTNEKWEILSGSYGFILEFIVCNCGFRYIQIDKEINLDGTVYMVDIEAVPTIH